MIFFLFYIIIIIIIIIFIYFIIFLFFSLQDIVATLEEQMRPLVQAELSVLVDVLHRPELLFPPGTEARKKCETGGFISRSVETSCFKQQQFLFFKL